MPDETIFVDRYASSVRKANMPFEILVTAGGTKVSIDDVRLISNISRGATWAAIATHALEAGHTVRYLANEDAALPYVGNIARRLWRGSGILQDRAYLGKIQILQSRLTDGKLSLAVAAFFQDYVDQVLAGIAPENALDAVILSAAVSDFWPKEAVSGKLDSKAGLSIPLEPLPKVRDIIRKVNQDIAIIAFKQMSKGTSQGELFDHAFASMESGDHDLVVANLTDSVQGTFLVEGTWILRKDGSCRPVERRKHLQDILVDEELPESVQKRRTNRKKADSLVVSTANNS